ncbi:Elicitin-like protein 6 precursor [Globisporangium polare]
MKSFAAFAAVALAALSTSPVSGAKCVLTELVTELEPITAMVYACYDATGYAVIPPRANPTAEQTAAVCAKCPEMIATAKTMTFNTCTFTVSGVDIPLNEWVPKITGACATTTSTSAGSAASSTPSVGSTTNTTTPAANSTSSSTSSTPAPASASKGSGSGSKTSSSSTVTAPTPTPSTAASAGVVTSLSVATTVVAVGSIAALLL